MTPKDRVQKHRDKLRARKYSRLDLWISGDLLDDLCTLARYRHVPLQLIVQEASKDAVGKYACTPGTRTASCGVIVTGYRRPL
jgi:hypothetical protein